MTYPAPFPRGFVLGRSQPGQADGIPVSWTTTELPVEGWFFSHPSDDAPNIEHDAQTGDWVLVHGLCLNADPRDPHTPPARYLLERLRQDHESFYDGLNHMGGRHLVLRGTRESLTIYNDASGTRSVYWSDSAELVASHLALLNEVHPHARKTDVQGQRASLATWDDTRFIGIRPLLPNHELQVPRWQIERFFPRACNRYESWSDAARREEFRAIWSTQIDNLRAQHDDLIMSVTGGADSRTALSLLLDYADEIEFFTYTSAEGDQSRWGKALAMDKTIVDQLKSLVTLRHQYFRASEQNPRVLEDLLPVVSRNTPHTHGQWLLPFYYQHFGHRNPIHLRANGFEIGRAHWGVRADNNTVDALQRLYGAETRSRSSGLPEEEHVRRFEEGLVQWQFDCGLHDYHLLDLYYWEVRSGRWLAEVFNETDIAFETLLPINVRALYEISLSYPPVSRQEGHLFSELINDTHPVLNFLGKNDRKNLYEQHRDDSRTAIPTISNAHRLGSTLFITHQDGTETRATRADTIIMIPREHFLSGTTTHRKVLVPSKPDPSSVSFTVDAPYSNQRGGNNFRYEIQVNGDVTAWWDGALVRRPVHVSVDGCRPDTQVSVVVRALRDRQNILSWENATRASIQDIARYDMPGAIEKSEPVTSTDAPGHSELQGS
ncbi:hypothetical protein [Kocuria sp.]|uniref:hypothetical protein n=1 Tax=Kocuria sp. TaxID=1871328 RepID=UPI0026DEA6FA|nr:hypothetical protein [Kocuria sp.]MDO5366876.1 hypothetical protein [Kocuria sp.]